MFTCYDIVEVVIGFPKCDVYLYVRMYWWLLSSSSVWPHPLGLCGHHPPTVHVSLVPLSSPVPQPGPPSPLPSHCLPGSRGLPQFVGWDPVWQPQTPPVQKYMGVNTQQRCVVTILTTPRLCKVCNQNIPCCILALAGINYGMGSHKAPN